MNVFEKLSILKKLSFFSTTRDDLLIQLAEHMEEIMVDSGDSIIKKGDVDSCLYILVNGSILIHNGKKINVELTAPAIFGELAALCPEKRTANVDCITNAHLMKLEHEPLFELIELEPILCKGIIKFLCKKLRSHYEELSF
ncbi:MAG: cyclic nucleotide-binding domain-containing protein [Chlamydiae bacterium]|nr:cyclic nucleotide-binding domain-containing protein [Chlamydiota bacterium]